MSKKPKDIKRALLLLERGEYTKVIRHLESKIPLYVESKEFYVILAKAFFYTGDYSGAKLYFDRGQKIKWDSESALFLAVLGLKRRDYNSSLRIWLDILDEEPDNKKAKLGLDSLKKYTTMEELDFFIQSKQINRLLPRKKIKLAKSSIISIFIILFLILTTVVAIKGNYINYVVSLFYGNETKLTNRDGITEFDLTGFNKNYIDFDGNSIYTFSGAQIEEYFNIASNLFLDNKDNRVRTYLNLIKYSNSNESIKQRAEILEEYLVDPDWSSYIDDITYSEVYKDIYQYENCMVKWKGTLSNLEIKNKKIHFQLLVGYDKGQVLEGIVPVELNENVKIQENLPIEVLGKIILKDNSFYLEAKSVMQYIIRK